MTLRLILFLFSQKTKILTTQIDLEIFLEDQKVRGMLIIATIIVKMIVMEEDFNLWEDLVLCRFLVLILILEIRVRIRISE